MFQAYSKANLQLKLAENRTHSKKASSGQLNGTSTPKGDQRFQSTTSYLCHQSRTFVVVFYDDESDATYFNVPSHKHAPPHAFFVTQHAQKPQTTHTYDLGSLFLCRSVASCLLGILLFLSTFLREAGGEIMEVSESHSAVEKPK